MLERNAATLSLVGLSADVRSSEATDALRIEPSSSAEAGDAFASRKRQPGFRSVTVREVCVWDLKVEREMSYTRDRGSEESFASLRELLRQLAGKRQAIDKLAERFYIRLSWYGASESPQATTILEPEDMRLLNELGLPLMGTVYFESE